MEYQSNLMSFESVKYNLSKFYNIIYTHGEIDQKKLCIKSLYLLLFAEFQGILKQILIAWLSKSKTVKFDIKYLIYIHYIYTQKKIDLDGKIELGSDNKFSSIYKAHTQEQYEHWDHIHNYIKSKLDHMPTSWEQLENILYGYFTINIGKMRCTSENTMGVVESYKFKDLYIEFVCKRNMYAHTSETMINIGVSEQYQIVDIEQEWGIWRNYHTILLKFLTNISEELFKRSS